MKTGCSYEQNLYELTRAISNGATYRFVRFDLFFYISISLCMGNREELLMANIKFRGLAWVVGYPFGVYPDWDIR
jgi:hypothetical protein